MNDIYDTTRVDLGTAPEKGGEMTVTVFAAEESPRVYLLSDFRKSVISFGRDNGCDIVIPSPFASRRHGRFVYRSGMWCIEDNGSVNGLVFNGANILSRALGEGDGIFINGRDESDTRGVLLYFSKDGKDITWNKCSADSSRKVTVGRDASCSIYLPYISVSRLHAEIEEKSDGWYLSDNSSTNGVSVNGKPVSGNVRLNEKDLITVTNTKLVFTSSGIYYCSFKGGVPVDSLDGFSVNDGLDFTGGAWESLYDTVDDDLFLDKDAELIYDSLKQRLKLIPFGDYLKRYIYLHTALNERYNDVPLSEYQAVIRESFARTSTPPSFVETTAKLSALSKNWLTQQTVKRNVVFLLGFGLNMGPDDVNSFLTKALREQQINPKDPFEAICWYCYKNRYGFSKFKELWERYKAAPAVPSDINSLMNEYTAVVQNTMYSVNNDISLISYVCELKAEQNASRSGVTAKEEFTRLYDRARELIAGIYNDEEEERRFEEVAEYRRKLISGGRLYDHEISERVAKFRESIRTFTKNDISEGDIEHIICSAIPTDRHGNLTPGKASALNEHFAGKRLSRQRIAEIRAGKSDVNRFDLITLNFFIFSQTLDRYRNEKQRYAEFVRSTNEILEKCLMGTLYIPNPYECFILMCILSEDPLGTYADVWEMSYDPE